VGFLVTHPEYLRMVFAASTKFRANRQLSARRSECSGNSFPDTMPQVSVQTRTHIRRSADVEHCASEDSIAYFHATFVVWRRRYGGAGLRRSASASGKKIGRAN
jgi:hypothetical protein